MQQRSDKIDQFLRDVRRRFNHHLWLTLLIRSMTCAGCVLLVVALTYVLRGHHVPPLWYPVVLVGALLVGSGVWGLIRHSLAEAARRADGHFDLKDTLRSYHGFRRAGHREGFYGLQAHHAHTQLQRVSVKDIPFAWPKRTLTLGLVMLLSSGLLSLKADSPKVVAAAELAQETLLDTEAINKVLKDLLEELTRDVDSEELARLMELEGIREMMAQLEKTPDLKEAMRQYARLERKLNSASAKLRQRQEQQLLDRMGRELRKEDRAKALGNRLVEREYKQAAAELDAFKMDPRASLREQREQLNRLKEMSGRMSSEARRSAAGRRSGQSGASSGSSGSSGQAGAEGDGSSEAGALAQALDQSARDYDKALSEAERQAQQGNEGDAQSFSQAANQSLANLGQYLKKMGAKRQAQSEIEKLLQALSQCQGCLGKPGTCLGSSPNAGGLDAGNGASDSINNEPAADTLDGYRTQLKGIKGRGPSTKTTETASDGAGTSTTVSGRTPQSFRRSVESFVRREDVPQAVKSGVKAYFENIHQIGEYTRNDDE